MLIKTETKDRLFRILTLTFASAIVALMVFMTIKMWLVAAPGIKTFGLGFLTGSQWNVVKEVFGALPFIYGTIISSLLALLIAVPLALGVSIYLAELAPQPVRGPVSFLVELLAAIPSVVYGLWGIFVLAPWLRTFVQPLLGKYFGFLPFFQGPPLGVGLLAGGVILAIMIIPTIASISRDVLLAVPVSQREAMLALGATRWETTWKAVLPYGKTGIIGSVILGLGRALGETMAVTMVIGNRPEISLSLFKPAYTMASVIANEFSEATSGLHEASLIEIGLVLFGVTVLVNAVARFLVWRVARMPEGVVRE
ncbi:MAG: phosphate ABC transporter permease subunit PstC [Bacillota bacterium]